MNKRRVILAILILGVLSIAIFLLTRPSKPPVRNVVTKTGSSSKYVVKKACDILTLPQAKQLFGTDNVTTNPEDNTAATDTNDIVQSSCTYVAKMGPAGFLTASNWLRAATSDAGNSSNTQQFTQKRPVNTQDVTGYGDRAYWNIQLGQLNILKGNTWYIVSFGSPTINQRTLGETDKLAKVIKDKLDYAPDKTY